MPRLNPWDAQYKRPERRTVTVAFTEPVEWAVTLREPSELDRARIVDQHQEWLETYVTGAGDQPPLPLLTPDGQTVTVANPILYCFACLSAMQIPAAGEEPYSLLDWVGIAEKFPAAFRELADAMGALTRPAPAPEDLGGN